MHQIITANGTAFLFPDTTSQAALKHLRRVLDSIAISQLEGGEEHAQTGVLPVPGIDEKAG